jgi:hypothetical protein
MTAVNTRLERWTKASTALAPDGFMAAGAQDLGWFDIELLERDGRAQKASRVDGVFAAADLENHRRLALSRLWVLGAYELVRTIAQRLRTTPGLEQYKISR